MHCQVLVVGRDVKKQLDLNSNKWDSCCIGGRWRGFFLLKDDAEGRISVSDFKTIISSYSADQARKRDINFEGMKKAERVVRLYHYEKFHGALAGRTLEEAADDLYNAGFYYSEDYQDYLLTKEEFLSREEKFSIVPYAVIKDGVWYERGEDADKWAEEFYSMLNSIPDNELLTSVDCHF